MGNISFAGLDLQDTDNFIVTDINYRSFPNRPLNTANLSRRPGSKFLTTEFTDKTISIAGHILSTTTSGLQNNVDLLQQTLARVEQNLIINDDLYSARTYVATCSNLAIPERNYSQTIVPFSADFIASDPFSYGALVTVSGTVVSGTVTFSGTTTISGTVFAEPTITLNPTGANAGDSGIRAFQVGYTPAGETLTVSGILNYSSDIALNYNNFTVTNSGVNGDFSGAFSRWEPGSTAFTITTVSGVHNGYLYKLSYRPRFY